MEEIGKHIVFDGYFGIDSPLATVGGGHKFLTELVAAIDMTIVMPPYILEYPVDPSAFSRILEALKAEKLTNSNLFREMAKLDQIRNGKLRGISGLLVLAESHIAYHTFPEYVEDNCYFVSMDIYSCKTFSTETCVQFLARNGIRRGHLLDIIRSIGGPQTVSSLEVNF